LVFELQETWESKWQLQQYHQRKQVYKQFTFKLQIELIVSLKITVNQEGRLVWLHDKSQI
jgi:hypothetical protein